MIVVHTINEKDGLPKDFTFEDYESFVHIYNCEVFQYGSSRVRYLCKSAHRIAVGEQLYKIDKIFKRAEPETRICTQILASKNSGTLSI